jgi:proteasome lid subunit RPN8/RPN11
MTESHAENGPGAWSVPQCPFTIEYSLRVMDDIRLAVMDAFFSLPRGGAEIGGVLIGQYADGRVTVTGYVALDCEHAMGPSFTLSERDEGKLRELLAEVRKGAAGVPVGWYHSHTRSEIFLSDADLVIHRRFFPEPWQIALVMKPHTFQPIRCGFFFREASGSIHASESYEEFTLDAQPMRPMPAGGIPMPVEPARPARVEKPNPAKTIEVDATVSAPDPVRAALPLPPRFKPEYKPPAAAPPAVKLPAVAPPIAKPNVVPPPVTTQPISTPVAAAPIETPKSLMTQEEEKSRPWLKRVVAIGLAAIVGLAGFQTRHQWAPKVWAILIPAPPPPVPFAPVGLSTTDADGQLQIRWDRFSQAVRQASGGVLTINDVGPAPRVVKLTPVMLQAGGFTYKREGESVTVTLALDEPNGGNAHEVASFLGKLPQVKTSGDSPELRRQRDAATEEASRLRRELAAEADRSRKLQKQLDDARAQLKEQMRKRMASQLPK